MADPLLLNAEQVKVLASLARLSIVANLRANGPQSISQLSSSLGIEPKGLYYHVRAMSSVGLLRLRNSKSANGRTHAVYEMTAPRFVYDTADSDPAMNQAIRSLTKAILRQNGRLWDRAMEELPRDAPEQDALFIETINVRLGDKDRAKFNSKILEVTEWAKSRNLKTGGTRVVLTTFACPVASKLAADME